MANLTRVLYLSLVSRFLPRRADARRRIIAALVAAVAFLSGIGSTHQRFEASSRTWNDTRFIHALPSLHSATLHRAEYAPRSERRLSLRVDVPLAVGASQAFALTRVPTVAPIATRSRPIAVAVARGYDATAPPVS